MKKWICILAGGLAIAVLVVVIFCGIKPTYECEEILPGFKDWLDKNSFVPGMSQLNMLTLLEGIRYQGKPITEDEGWRLSYYDADWGGGCQTSGEKFGFSNSYREADDGKTATYSNSFFTKVNFDNLSLPFDVEIGEELYNILNRMGLQEIDENTNEMTLLKSENAELVFNNTSSCFLLYTESSNITLTDDRVSNVKRSVKLYFQDKNSELLLNSVSVSVQELYPI